MTGGAGSYRDFYWRGPPPEHLEEAFFLLHLILQQTREVTEPSSEGGVLCAHGALRDSHGLTIEELSLIVFPL